MPLHKKFEINKIVGLTRAQATALTQYAADNAKSEAEVLRTALAAYVPAKYFKNSEPIAPGLRELPKALSVETPPAVIKAWQEIFSKGPDGARATDTVEYLVRKCQTLHKDQQRELAMMIQDMNDREALDEADTYE